jgi:SAM-dependent methyltransferase
MKNRHLWKPSKFVMTKRGYRGSNEVGLGSRLIADILAKVYEKAIRQHAYGLLLDLGCGKVPLYELYKDYVSDNICVDWVDTLLKSLHLDYEFDLNDGIALPDEKFDTLLVTDVLEHISNPRLLWSEMARVLKPMGKLILGVPFLYRVHDAPHDYYRYTEYKLRLFCEDNGFTVLYLEPYGGSPEVMLDIIAKHIGFSKILSHIHLFFSKAFINSIIGKKLSAKTSSKFPLGYCLVAQKTT